ncbi:MAG TPA: UPF0182 family protein [Egibacteraceae bacterium]|nr:UPF0182 family protein [Egibacteraceae bacterium]
MRLLEAIRRRWWLGVVLIAFFLFLVGGRVATFYTDILWFDSVGFSQVFWTLLGTKIGLGAVAGTFLAALLAVNMLLARRLAPPYRIPSLQEESVERYRELLEPFTARLLLGLALLIGLFAGLSMAAEWPTYLLWANAVDFGIDDPHFGVDLSYFVFRLPFYTLINSWLFTSLLMTTALAALVHYVFGGIRPQSAGVKVTPQASAHLSILLAALVAVRGWGYYLDQFLLSYSPRGQVTGLSYTDVNAQLVAYRLLVVIAAVTVLLFLANLRVRGWLLPSAGVGVLVIAAVVLSGIYPAIIQRLRVDPQELSQERQYIERNLEMTRYAFGLRIDEDVTFESFPANSSLEPSQVEASRTTLESIRLWDPATLQNTYQQLQELRPYYDFRDVDVDRYVLDGETQQVMISVREISEDDLPATAQTWQNQRLVYTHGYGLVASTVSTKRRDGQPQFLVQDMPPIGVPELAIENPRVYFGENPPTYSIVSTGEQELDYPVQEGDPALYEYTGQDGVAVGSPMRRLAFALRFAEPNIVLSNLIERDSRILFQRNIRRRVEAVAPFLKIDHDPYPVAVDGRIKWVLDAYTTTDMVPYSQRVDLAQTTQAEQRVLVLGQSQDGTVEVREELRNVPGLSGTANYIRNSVKAVVDAYDGTVTLYVMDDEDPLLRVWRDLFPASFTDASEAGEEMIRHFRYPEDMFRVQSAMFNTYHIAEADQFYTKEDAWTVPFDAAFAQNNPNEQDRIRPMRPYYLLMRLPGEEREEFALIQPFTPVRRNNLIGWLAGRSDPENYGQLKAYLMPPNRTVFGPQQIQARIDQDDRISEQITLWNQSGARVIYGNLLVIPVEDSLLYAQPLFLRAQQSDIPELRRTVLVFGDQVVMEDTLAEALARLFGEAAPPVEDPDATPGEPDDGVPQDGVDPRVAELIREALERFADAERALTDGDLGEYQEQTRQAEQLLRDAQELVDGPLPTPEPEGDATPAPEPTLDDAEQASL